MRLPSLVHGVVRVATTLLPLIATAQLRAQLDLMAAPATIQGGYTSALTVFELNGGPGHAPVRWQWELVGEPQGGQFIQSTLGPRFLAPRVKVPTTFRVRVTDPRDPANMAEVAILVRPNLTLSTSTPTLISNSEGQIRMMRGEEELLEPAGEERSPFCWEVVKHWVVPHGEAVQRKLSPNEMNEALLTESDGRTRFIAPFVSVPTRFVIEVCDASQADDLATLDILVQPEIIIQPLTRLKQTLLAGEKIQFRALRGDGNPADWEWGVTPPHDGDLIHGVDSLATFTAPEVDRATTFDIEVTDHATGSYDAIQVHVMPRLPGLPSLIAGTLMTNQMGQNWMAPVPSMYPFAGQVAPLAQGLAPVFKDISGIAFVDDPALAGLNLHKKWLVADQSGLQVLPYLGKTATPLAGTQGVITALAVRPRVSLAANHRHVVFALAQDSAAISRADIHRGLGNPGASVLHLDPSGAVQLLAGTLTQDPHLLGFQDGPGLAARFGAICGLAMDRDGTVYVADAGNRLIRRIRPDGMVDTLAGTTVTFGDPQDGMGTEARFRDLCAMTLDPMTHHLYVIDGSKVRQVTLAGEVTTLMEVNEGLGWQNRPGSVGLACHGEHLFIARAASNLVSILNLKTRKFGTLAGNPIESVTRMGPLAWFSPYEWPGTCAALNHPRAVATNADGMCLVGLEEGLVQLDLHTLDHRAALRQFRRKARPAAVAAPAAGRHGKRKVEGEEEGAVELPAAPAPASAASSSPGLPLHKRPHTDAVHQ